MSLTQYVVTQGLPRRRAALLSGALLAFSGATFAEPFSVELGVAYDRDEVSSSVIVIRLDDPVFLPGPAPVNDVLRSETETDTTAAFARWFYNGASAAEGPRSRAGFVSRASAVSLFFLEADGETSVDSSAGVSRNEVRDVALEVRHVFARSGWYLFGTAALADTNSSTPGRDGPIEFDGESDRFVAGFGKYLGKTTSLDLSVLRFESELELSLQTVEASSTEYALSFTHIADLSAGWQYGLDLSVSTVEQFGEEGRLSAQGSLFPSRSLAFGVNIDTQIESAFDDGTRYGFFASWFPQPWLELVAQANFTTERDIPSTLASTEGDGFGLGLRARF